jgi:hypothetical protein
MTLKFNTAGTKKYSDHMEPVGDVFIACNTLINLFSLKVIIDFKDLHVHRFGPIRTHKSG